MDLLSNLTKAFTDYFSTSSGYISLMLIVVTAIITTIINHTLPAIGRFIKKSRRVFPMLKRRLQSWWYWQRFKPKCSISPIGKVRVEAIIEQDKEDVHYRIFFQFKLQCQNRDSLNRLNIDCNYSSRNMYFELRAKNINVRTKPYFCSYKEGAIRWSVLPNEKDEQIYLVEGNDDVKPVLGKTVHCKAIYLTYARIGNSGRPIKVSPFNIEVEKFEPMNKDGKTLLLR